MLQRENWSNRFDATFTTQISAHLSLFESRKSRFSKICQLNSKAFLETKDGKEELTCHFLLKKLLKQYSRCFHKMNSLSLSWRMYYAKQSCIRYIFTYCYVFMCFDKCIAKRKYFTKNIWYILYDVFLVRIVVSDTFSFPKYNSKFVNN